LGVSRKRVPLGTGGSIVGVQHGTLVRTLRFPVPPATCLVMGWSTVEMPPGGLTGVCSLPRPAGPLVPTSPQRASPPLPAHSSFDAKMHAAVVRFQRSQKAWRRRSHRHGLLGQTCRPRAAGTGRTLSLQAVVLLVHAAQIEPLQKNPPEYKTMRFPKNKE